MTDLATTLTIIVGAAPPSGGSYTLVCQPNPITIGPGDSGTVTVRLVQPDGSVVDPPAGTVLGAFWGGNNFGINAFAQPDGKTLLISVPVTAPAGPVTLSVYLKNTP